MHVPLHVIQRARTCHLGNLAPSSGDSTRRSCSFGKMPALQIYGRRWHTTTDMIPVPAIAGVVFHGAWVIAFAGLIGGFHEWRGCRGEGVHYIVTTAGLLGVFAFAFVAETALTFLGFQGETPSASLQWRSEDCDG